MAIITQHHGPTLKKLYVQFDGVQLSEVFPFFPDLPSLEDLGMFIESHPSDVELLCGPVMPKLRVLSIKAYPPGEYLTQWLNSASFPMLKEVNLDSSGAQWPRMSPFMSRHGPSLTTLGFSYESIGVATEVFPHTPNLKFVKVGTIPLYKGDIVEGFRRLPCSVTVIRCSNFGCQLGYYATFLEQFRAAIEQLPPERALSAIQIVQHSGQVPFRWKDALKLADKRRLDTWDVFTKTAVRLLELGVAVLGSDGVSLTDALAEEVDSGNAPAGDCVSDVESPEDVLGGITLGE